MLFTYFYSMQPEQKQIIKSFILPFSFVAILWIIKLAEIYSATDLSFLGILPRHIKGLIGIVTMPFIHADFKHLFSNSVPLIVLGACLLYFYREVALSVFLLTYFLHSSWLWLGGREVYHIGASGLVYGLAAFLFFSGILRRYIRLIAISLLVVFLYGGMIWGIFPLFIGMSWEAHLFGTLAGLLCAWIYRKKGPQRPVYEWENEDEGEETGQPENTSEDSELSINYQYTPKQEKENSKDEKN